MCTQAQLALCSLNKSRDEGPHLEANVNALELVLDAGVGGPAFAGRARGAAFAGRARHGVVRPSTPAPLLAHIVPHHREATRKYSMRWSRHAVLRAHARCGTCASAQ